jgi:diguanylate cyclase (GGDEF)-like protein
MRLLISDAGGRIIKEQSLYLVDGGLKIGRSENCTVVIDSLSISREHALIQLEPDGRIRLQDLQSTFGTFLNGKKLQPGMPVQIQPGDRIQLSEEINIILKTEPGDEPPPTPLTESESAIFPFFMVNNERHVRDSFQQFRAGIPADYHEGLARLEKLMFERVQELSAFLEVSFALSSLFNLQKLLDYSLDMAIKVTGAERGFLMLYNEEIDKLEVMAMRKMGTTEVERDMQASSSLVDKCFKSGQTLVIADTSVDPATSSNKSIVMNRIRSVAVTPLRIKNSTIGVLYLDNRLSSNIFNDRIQEMLKVFAAHASVTIHNTKLFHMATTDGLTGLTNHKHFQQRLLEEFCRALRHRKFLSLILIDIDHFKLVNDTYGHQAGDQALRIMGKILRTNMRIHDVPARYGGEEFAILLPESSSEGAKTLAEKLRVLLEKAFFSYGEHKVRFTISIGVATASSDMSKPADLIRTADQALYQAKEGGRNRCIVGIFSPEISASA